LSTSVYPHEVIEWDDDEDKELRAKHGKQALDLMVAEGKYMVKDSSNLFKPGDILEVIKQGSQLGNTGMVVDPNWEGRIRLKMAGTDEMKSYLATEVKIPMARRDSTPRPVLGL
jgi:hypothetical protein